MNKPQKILLAIFLPFTAFIYVFTVLFRDTAPVLYFKFSLRVLMLLVLLVMMKRSREHVFLLLAFAASVFSDYFFVYSRTFDYTVANRLLFGMLGFVVSYLFLIAAFSRNFRLGKSEAINLIPFIAAFSFVFFQLRQYASGFMFYAALLLGAVLCVFGMVTVSTLFGRYSPQAAWFIAAAGIIAFTSDMVVAYSIFHPQFKGYIQWKEIFIWVTYIPAWTFLLVAVAADRLLRREQNQGANPLEASAGTRFARPARRS